MRRLNIYKNKIGVYDIDNWKSQLSIIKKSGLPFTFNFWDSDTSTFKNLSMYMLALPEEEAQEQIVKTKNVISILFSYEDYKVALNGVGVTFRLPSDKDTFLFNNVKYKVVSPVVNEYLNRDGTITSLSITLQGVPFNELQKNLTLR